ncbi:flippase [Paraneptunicella aestuarii]|uniref:flippase n=1 Tax=Paraneptunicella aestuarii TaxID=2831148 RepID=UPI001E37D9A9|nr:flippase [Paraneptunicella aestuarii]UAA39144.1 flippase [Paraneptunicella aestuarii]
MTASLPKRIFNNINWILVEKVSKAGLTALTSILVARYLGADGLGAISIALTLYSIFAVFGTLGLERFLLKELETQDCVPEKLIGGSLLLRLFGAFLASALMNFVVPFAYPDNSQLQLMVFVLSFAFFIAVGNVFEVFYRHQLRSKYVTVVRVLGLFASAFSKLLIIWLGLDVVWFTLPVLLETAVVSISFMFLRYRDPELALDKLQFQLTESKRILNASWPLFFSGLVGTLYFQLDKVVIYQYLDEASLGRYTLLFQLVSILTFLIHSINLSVTPMLNKLYFESVERFWQRYREVTALKSILALLVGIGLVGLGNIVIPFLVGDEFIYSTSLFLIFACYFVFVSIGSLQAEYCVLIGVVKPLFYLRVITLSVNLVLNIILIPIWGLEGAAFASVASYFLNQFILPCLIREMRPMIRHNIAALNLLIDGKFYRDIYVKSRMLV